jgi:hypothetical protein
MPDIVKIDVEGAELLAVRGANETLSNDNPPIFMIEYTAANAAQFGGYGFLDILESFPKNRFKSYRIESPGRLREFGKDGLEPTNDYLVVPLDKISSVEPLIVG